MDVDLGDLPAQAMDPCEFQDRKARKIGLTLEYRQLSSFAEVGNININDIMS
jgi:hypothetical protein